MSNWFTAVDLVVFFSKIKVASMLVFFYVTSGLGFFFDHFSDNSEEISLLLSLIENKFFLYNEAFTSGSFTL